MKFFLRYVVVYVLVAVALLAFVAYTGFSSGMGNLTWVAVAAFAAWMLVYHPLVLWLDYRRLLQLIVELRSGQLGGRIDTGRVRESVQRLAVEYAGVPQIVAALLVPRLLNDELIRQIVARTGRA
jgi:hypothetical protein